MPLMTIRQMQNELAIFKDRSESSVRVFLYSRGVKIKERKQKIEKFGNTPGLYDLDEVLSAWDKNPLKNEFGAPKIEYSKQRRYKKPHECTDFESVKDAPFRNYMCPDYRECMNKATLVLCCNDCEKKHLVDPDWRLK